MENLILSLGGNIGNVSKNFEIALEKIEEGIGKIEAKSSKYKTEPWGNTNQDFFLNQVIVVKTQLKPDEVLNEILAIEKLMGRNRDKDNQYAPRSIDIDILFYGDKIIHGGNLIIPHPRLHQRNFVLTPLMEIAPDLVHPVLNKKIKDLFAESKDKSLVTKK